MCRFVVALGAIVVLATPASAQDSPGASQAPAVAGRGLPISAHINVGYRSGTENWRQAGSFPLYDETASWDAGHRFTGGTTVDVGGAVGLGKLMSRLRKVSVGATFTTRSRRTRDVAVTAALPHPVFTDTHRTAAAALPGLANSERAVHFQVLYHLPLTGSLTMAPFVGPSMFSVRADFVEGLAVAEVGGDLSAVNVEASRSGRRDSAAGFNVGVDLRYTLLRNVAVMREVGVGALVRYSRGRVNFRLPGNSGGTQKIDVGGPELGVGLRMTF